jgi:hypothetical protein
MRVGQNDIARQSLGELRRGVVWAPAGLLGDAAGQYVRRPRPASASREGLRTFLQPAVGPPTMSYQNHFPQRQAYWHLVPRETVAARW